MFNMVFFVECSLRYHGTSIYSCNLGTEEAQTNVFVKHECTIFRSSRPEVFLYKDVLKTCSKFTGQHSCWSVISIKLQSSFIEITLCHGCSPVNLRHIFRTPFPKNTSGWLLLNLICYMRCFSKIQHLSVTKKKTKYNYKFVFI